VGLFTTLGKAKVGALAAATVAAATGAGHLAYDATAAGRNARDQQTAAEDARLARITGMQAGAASLIRNSGVAPYTPKP
jgi:hypothetical protein